MHLVILILGVLLFPKDLSALECNQCAMVPGLPTEQCAETQECAAAHKCGALTMRTSQGERSADVQLKTCLASTGCGFGGSMNVGTTKIRFSSTCCSTDRCNVQYPTLPASSSSPNGKKCYTCNGNDCTAILECSGDEDRCISGQGQKGCVSRSLCGADAIPGMSAAVSCCEGDLCNSATSTVVSLLLLLAPVVSVALFN